MILRRTGLVGLVLASMLGLAAAVGAPAGADTGSGTGSSVFGDTSVTKAPPAGKGPRTDVTAPALTSDFDGKCDFGSNGFGDFCIYSGSFRSGVVADFTTDRPNLFLTWFPTMGMSVGANAVSGANEDAFRYVIVWTNPNYIGVSGPISPGQSGDFCPPFFKNVGSFKFV